MTLKNVGELVKVIVFRELTYQFTLVFPAPVKAGKVSKYGAWSSYRVMSVNALNGSRTFKTDAVMVSDRRQALSHHSCDIETHVKCSLCAERWRDRSKPVFRVVRINPFYWGVTQLVRVAVLSKS